jgi:hypothetical protein
LPTKAIARGRSSSAIRARRSALAGEVAAAQVAGAAGRAVGGVREPDAVLDHDALLGRTEEPRSEAGVVQEPPEVVARVREVRARGGRDAAGIDAAEDGAEPGRQHVRDGRGCRHAPDVSVRLVSTRPKRLNS